MRIFITFIAILLLSFPTNAQNFKVDSLYAMADTTSDLIIKELILETLSEELMGVSLDQSLKVTNERIELNRILKNKEFEGDALIWKARVLGELNRLDSAMFSLDKAEDIFLNLRDSFYLAKLYNEKGIIYKYQGKYEKALKVQYISAEISERMEMYENAANSYNSLGNIHVNLNHMGKAVAYYEKAISNLEKTGSKRALSGALLNLANILDEDTIKKMTLYSRCEKIAVTNGYDRILGYLYAGKGDYYTSIESDIDSQKLYFNKAVQFANNANDTYMIAYSKLYLGIIDYNSNPSEAEQNIRLSMHNEYIRNDDFLKAEGNFYLSKSLFNQKEYQDAFITLDTSLFYYRKIYDINVAKAASEADAKYESKKKDAEIAKQELKLYKQQSNKNKILGGSAFVFFLIFGFFIWYYEQQKRKKKDAQVVLVKKQLEAQKYKELDILKNQFFTNITHELRTPLTLIMGPLVNALEKTNDTSLKKDLYLAQNNTHRLLDMINEILELSKLESGKVPINEDEVEINQFFQRILYSFQSIAEMRDIRLDFNNDVKEKNIVVLDIEKMETILNNLLSNAIKFSPSNATIHMNVSKENKNLKISIQDQGPGISLDDQKHIFNRFYQASNKHNNTEGGGTGVGLALSKSLINLMNGTIQVESNLGDGSKFLLTFPTIFKFAQSENQTKILAENEKFNYEPILFNGEKPHILIIEDNSEMQIFIKSILEEEYKISIANDGFHGLQLLQTNNYDLVSCDVMMPKMDGFSLKEKTNQLDLHMDIPFVFLTAKILEEDRLRGLRLGVDDYITKPFNKYEYKARIHNLLANRKSRLEYLSLNTDFALQDRSSVDFNILKKAELLVHNKVSDPNLKVNDLASELNYSQRQLARIIKKLTGMTAVQFILELRLQRAYQLIKSNKYATISEVQYEVGIESASYFTRKFKERYGISPGEII